MLQNPTQTFDLIAEKAKLENLIPIESREYFYSQKDDVYDLQYPVIHYPAKVASLNLDKTPSFQGRLVGIKGQYLIFENGTVFNVRGSEGYVVTIDV